MAEVSTFLYDIIQKYVKEQITYIQLLDDTDTEIDKISIDDSKVTWVHPTKEIDFDEDRMGNKIPKEVPDGSTLTLQVEISGTDVSSLPTTFSKSKILGGNLDNDFSTESFSNFTMKKTQDKITIKHSIEIPQVQ